MGIASVLGIGESCFRRGLQQHQQSLSRSLPATMKSTSSPARWDIAMTAPRRANACQQPGGQGGCPSGAYGACIAACSRLQGVAAMGQASAGETASAAGLATNQRPEVCGATHCCIKRVGISRLLDCVMALRFLVPGVGLISKHRLTFGGQQFTPEHGMLHERNAGGGRGQESCKDIKICAVLGPTAHGNHGGHCDSTSRLAGLPALAAQILFECGSRGS